MNADLGEFVSTIYPCKFESQKVQAADVPKALAKLTHAETLGPTGPSIPLLAAQAFLIELSSIMLGKENRGILIPPDILHLAGRRPHRSHSHIPVSLALINLRLWSKKSGGIPPKSYVTVEADIAVALVSLLRRCFPDDDIFVATPHRIQRDAVKMALRKALDDETLEESLGRLSISDEYARHGVTVETIERLQGSEAPFVICLFSTPISSPDHLGFLLERRRLNVAISRTKTLCIVISSDAVLSPPTRALANETTTKGYAFLKEYQRRSWCYELPLEV
ncbi:hypothetical protein CVT26_012081 [Gymnopilus dilepis]|uniref:DNA2/NAM7 helicase-like C-terminal domain-containing protein n=1 Tax=Gymnopilus dilepis TaxID=231916 RepID=A0A409W9H3_9AGAR|nr:hypothetical protein CVT26_012081 [Gymnopilus dilepis]